MWRACLLLCCLVAALSLAVRADVTVTNATLLPFRGQPESGWGVLGFAATGVTVPFTGGKNASGTVQTFARYDAELALLDSTVWLGERYRPTAAVGVASTGLGYFFGPDTLLVFDSSDGSLRASDAASFPSSGSPLWAWAEADGSTLYTTATRGPRGNPDAIAYAVDPQTLAVSAPVPVLLNGSPLTDVQELGPCGPSPLPGHFYCSMLQNFTSSLLAVEAGASAWSVSAQLPGTAANYLVSALSPPSPDAPAFWTLTDTRGPDGVVATLSAFDSSVRPLWNATLSKGQAAGLLVNPALNGGNTLLVSTVHFVERPLLQDQQFYLIDGVTGAIINKYRWQERNVMLAVFGSLDPYCAPFYVDPDAGTLSLVSVGVAVHGRELLYKLTLHY